MNPTILLVDDLQMFLEIEKDFFRYADVNILTARDGVEALELAKSKKPNLVFMDLQMPRMDGAACCRALRSDPQLSRIPVVIISSSTGETDREECLSAGCNYFLTKPAGRDRFLEIAREFIPGINRRENRIRCDFKAMLTSDGETSRCSLYDLGSDGAFILTSLPGKPGNVVTLTFSLPDGARIESPCKVIWASGSGSPRPQGLGVKFALMPKDSKTALSAFLESQRKTP